MARVSGSQYKMSKSLKRVLATMPKGAATTAYKQIMIAAEIHAANWSHTRSKDRTASQQSEL